MYIWLRPWKPEPAVRQIVLGRAGSVYVRLACTGTYRSNVTAIIISRMHPFSSVWGTQARSHGPPQRKVHELGQDASGRRKPLQRHLLHELIRLPPSRKPSPSKHESPTPAIRLRLFECTSYAQAITRTTNLIHLDPSECTGTNDPTMRLQN